MEERLDLLKIEEEVQRYWEKENIYREACELRKTGPKFYFCQGPPFTSGQAHIGHAWNHSIKDAVLRYKTMRGYDVYRRAGWDTHGLPIEVKVEEEVLRSRCKKDIEEFGVKNFVAECKRFVVRNMHRMTEQLQRLGVWLDWENPYVTMDKHYIDGVWFCIKRAWEKGLLYEAERVIHWCPRCETAMAGYEVREEYKDVRDPSVYVAAKIKGGEKHILVWTTTPWTLPANVAIAVHPELTYAEVKVGEKLYILAEHRVEEVLKGVRYEVVKKLRGKELEGMSYEPILDIEERRGIEHRVVLAPELVRSNEGTGCVHIAPGHGEEDFELGQRCQLPVLCFVDEQGRLTVKRYRGLPVREANSHILDDLRRSERLLKEETIVHPYPHCWRCKTPLILRATKQWFLAVSRIKQKLLEKNEEIEWVPDWIGEGRFRNWLLEAKDWCISRQRYWNTPLPIWRCDTCGKLEVIGSIEELAEKATSEINPETFDPHRPAIDEVKLRCSCGDEMRRVPDVLDVWLDSGSASWAALGYPREKEGFEGLFPADFITEGSDQTRGWFYSLLVCSVIAFDEIPYKRVLYHGFTLDERGRKMSKSLGNVIDPEDVISSYGADVLRFYMLVATAPWEDLRFSWRGVKQIDKLFNVLWNSYRFVKRYAELDSIELKKLSKPQELGVEDHYLLSRLNSLVLKVTEAFDSLQLHEACKLIQDFILELSRWYLKLVRERLWSEELTNEKLAAYYALSTTFETLLKLLAPFAPHLAEYLYRDLTGERSVHLCDWPEAELELIDERLEERVKLAEELVECALSLRREHGIKLRWPIRKVVVALKREVGLEPVKDIVLKAVNAKVMEIRRAKCIFVPRLNYLKLGPKLGRGLKVLEERLREADLEGLREKMAEEGFVEVAGVKLSQEELEFELKVIEEGGKGFSAGFVSIDPELDEELLLEGLAKDVIRRIQEMRKELRLEETERIRVWIEACGDKLRRSIESYRNYIARETRSELHFGLAEGVRLRKDWEVEGERLRLAIS